MNVIGSLLGKYIFISSSLYANISLYIGEEHMGTWSAEVFGNDTSCEIKEYFYEQYNRGSEVTQIVSMYTQCLLSTVGIGVQYNLAYSQFVISIK